MHSFSWIFRENEKFRATVFPVHVGPTQAEFFLSANFFSRKSRDTVPFMPGAINSSSSTATHLNTRSYLLLGYICTLISGSTNSSSFTATHLTQGAAFQQLLCMVPGATLSTATAHCTSRYRHSDKQTNTHLRLAATYSYFSQLHKELPSSKISSPYFNHASSANV